MSCNLDNLNEEFPHLNLHSKSTVNISSHDKSGDLLKRLNMIQDEMSLEGFTPKIYKIAKVGKEAILQINKEALENYDSFRENEYKPTERKIGNILKLVASSTIEEIEEDESRVKDSKNVNQNIEYSLESPVRAKISEIKSEKEAETIISKWVEQLNTTIEELKNVKSQLLGKPENTSKEELNEINKSIASLTKEINSYKNGHPETIKNSLEIELNELTRVLAITEEDPIKLANAITSSKIPERITKIENILLSDATKSSEQTLYYAALKLLIPESEFNVLQDRIARVKRDYLNLIDEVIYNKIIGSEYLKELKAVSEETMNPITGKELSEKEIDKRLKQWDDFETTLKELLTGLDKDGNLVGDTDGTTFISRTLLAADSNNSVLGKAIVLQKAIQSDYEFGRTSGWRKALETSYKVIEESYLNTEGGKRIPLIDFLFKKDEFGNVTDRLISPHTSNWDAKNNTLDLIRATYYTTDRFSEERTKAFNTWMKNLKDNTDFIRLSHIKSFKDSHINTPEFKNFFTATDKEMEDYEKEVISKIGKIAFDIEVKKQKALAEKFLINPFNSGIEKEMKNPMAFVENFYTKDITEADEFTGSYRVPSKTYLSHMPKMDNDKFFNETFKIIEQEFPSEFFDLYTSAFESTRYIKQSLMVEGKTIDAFDLPSLRELGGRAVMEELSLTGKITKTLENRAREFKEGYLKGSFENRDEDKNYIRDRDAKVASHYSSHFKNVKGGIINSLYEMDYEKLYNLAKGLGMILSDKYKPDRLEKMLEKEVKNGLVESKRNINSLLIKKRLASGVARSIANKTSSLDINKRLSYGLSIAESFNVRKSIENFSIMLQEYAKKRNQTGAQKLLRQYHAQNILEVGHLNENNLLSKLDRKSIPFINIYSAQEKLLSDFIEGEKQNLDDKNYFNFTFKGEDYFTIGDKYYKVEKGEDRENKSEVKLEKIISNYGLYLDEKLNALGTSPVVGNMIKNIVGNMYTSYLSFNPFSGIRGVLDGRLQNEAAAASGKYDFNGENLNSARQFLVGIGRFTIFKDLLGEKASLKALNSISGVVGSKRRVEKAQQWGVMLYLAEGLGLLDIVRNTYALGEGVPKNKITHSLSSFASEIGMNVSVGLQEIHNQMETFVSLAQNMWVEVADENGNPTGEMERLFNADPKVMAFPFDPHTMKLLPKYSTPNNRANWERFQAAPNGRSKHLYFKNQHRRVNTRTQGDYRDDNKIGASAYTTTQALVAMSKWFFENQNNQWGEDDVDFNLGKAHNLGRKRVLLLDTPTFLTHVLISNIGIVSTTNVLIGEPLKFIFHNSDVLQSVFPPTLLNAGGIALKVLPGVVPVLVLAYYIYKTRKQINISANSVKFTLTYLAESILRTIRSGVIMASRFSPVKKYRYNSFGFTEARISELLGITPEKWTNTKITLEQRKEISANAQELATAMTYHLAFLGLGIFLKMMMLYASNKMGGEDEDKRRRLREMDYVLRMVENNDNNILSGAMVSTNARDMKGVVENTVTLDFISNSYNKYTSAVDLAEKGLYGQASMAAVSGLSKPILGTPNQVWKALTPGESLLGNKWVYSGQDDKLFDIIEAIGKSKEDLNKKIVYRNRKQATKLVENIYYSRLTDAGKSKAEAKELIKINTKDLLERHGAYAKRKGNTDYEKINERVDWNNLVDDAENGKLLLDKKKKAKREKKSEMLFR